jgi:hypothetical protein
MGAARGAMAHRTTRMERPEGVDRALYSSWSKIRKKHSQCSNHGYLSTGFMILNVWPSPGLNAPAPEARGGRDALTKQNRAAGAPSDDPGSAARAATAGYASDAGAGNPSVDDSAEARLGSTRLPRCRRHCDADGSLQQATFREQRTILPGVAIDVGAEQYRDRLQRRHVGAEQDDREVKGTARSAPATLQIQPQKITDSRRTSDDALSALSVSRGSK